MNRYIRACIALMTIIVALGVVAQFHRYFPANFRSGFLLNRETYFWGWYSAVFYLHIILSPLSLVVGVLLFSKRLLKRMPGLHRKLGRLYVYSVLLIVVPSGLLMAIKSYGGIIPTLAFVTQGIVTWIATFLGLVSAMRRKFKQHQEWMQRSFLLMFAAVILRINEQLLRGIDPVLGYQINSWISWLPVLLVCEWLRVLEKSSSTIPNLKRAASIS